MTARTLSDPESLTGTTRSAAVIWPAEAGILEIVADDDGRTYRGVYTVRFPELVYVLDVFQKTSRRGIATPKQEIELIRKRLAAASADYARRARMGGSPEMDEEITFEETRGNVFAALGFEDPDLELAKALLSGKIAAEIDARGWTQQRAAEVLGIDQPRVSRLVAGKTGQFSLERLIGFLERLSFDVRIEARPAPEAARGRVTVAV